MISYHYYARHMIRAYQPYPHDQFIRRQVLQCHFDTIDLDISWEWVYSISSVDYILLCHMILPLYPTIIYSDEVVDFIPPRSITIKSP